MPGTSTRFRPWRKSLVSDPLTSPNVADRAGVEELAAGLAGPGTEVDEVVGRADQVVLVLDDDAGCCRRRAAGSAPRPAAPTSC